MWLAVAIAGYLLLAIVSVLDKFLVSTERLRPVMLAFYSTAPLVVIILLWPFGVRSLESARDFWLAVVSGAAFVGALWTMYIGFDRGEVSHSGPLLGAALPLATLLIGAFWLRETITLPQLFGIQLLIIGSLIISLPSEGHHHGWARSGFWIIAAGFLFALSNIAAKDLYDHYGFYSGFMWTRLLIGICGLALWLSPAVRASLASRPARHRTGRQWSSFKDVGIFAADKIGGVLGAILIQYAIAAGSVTIVNALSGVQYAFLILVVAGLSRFSPALFKEKYGRGEIKQELLAVAVIVAGLWLVVAR